MMCNLEVVEELERHGFWPSVDPSASVISQVLRFIEVCISCIMDVLLTKLPNNFCASVRHASFMTTCTRQLMYQVPLCGERLAGVPGNVDSHTRVLEMSVHELPTALAGGGPK